PNEAEVRSGAEQAAEDQKGVDEFVRFIRYFLLAFGGIALFVGAFVIFNTLSITVAQRTRELGTLRSLGASRAQVLGSVVLEGLALGAAASVAGLALGIALAEGVAGVVHAVPPPPPAGGARARAGPALAAPASVAGLALGIALAKGLAELFKALQLDLPRAGTVVEARTVVIS